MDEKRRRIFVSLIISAMISTCFPALCTAGITDIRTRTDFNSKVLSSSDPKILLFSADWCRYCQKLKPIVEKVSKEYRDELEIYIIDVDSLGRLSQDYNIQGLPTVVIMKDGEEQSRLVGYNKEEVIRSVFDKNFK